MSVNRIWKIKGSKITEEITGCCNGSRILAVLLANRGINTKEKIQNFLNPLKGKLTSPDVFTDMEKAANRITKAIESKEHITVYGDFDSDGVTSTALLYKTLFEIGANVDFYLPDRAGESHGLNTKALVNIISKRKSKLIITVDCGISNVQEVNFAKSFKTDIIITDHHEAPEILPNAYAIINPKVKGNTDENLDIESIEGLNYLAGAGVAFKLACKLLSKYNKENFVNEILPLAAIGTIGDVVELIGENRSLAAMGLELLKSGKQKGVQKLLKAAGITNTQDITSETIAFTVVPRLNAAGRLEKPDTAIELFISDDDEKLDTTVSTLNDLNELRQNLCEETFTQAKQMYEKEKYKNKNSIILFNNDWHIGIIGIVCSKLVEEYNRPAFLMTRDANSPNVIRCSCRSVSGINVHEVLSELKDLFLGFGGHKMAAGFSFDENKLSFEQFKEKLKAAITNHSENFDFSKQIIEADMELEPSDITEETVRLIDKLQPFGSANPSPLFVLNDATMTSFKMMGQHNNHLKMFLNKNSSQQLECVKWNCPNFNLPVNSKLNVLFSLKLNCFNGNTSVQLMLADIYSEHLKQKQEISVKILDHRKKKNILMQVLDFLMNTKKKTAIFAKSKNLLKQITLPEEYKNLIFSEENIPEEKEQIMFFEAPDNENDFTSIITQTQPNIVHLMNFNEEIIGSDKYLTKLSGMLKYALSNLDGKIEIQRIANALNSSSETVECALELFEAAEMIDMEKIAENTVKISYIHPLELSKIKQNELFKEFNQLNEKSNEFKEFYQNAQLDEIKRIIGQINE